MGEQAMDWQCTNELRWVELPFPQNRTLQQKWLGFPISGMTVSTVPQEEWRDVPFIGNVGKSDAEKV